jgi:NAD(P)-dependent dehydrogenase (short-subunit alcohol dehydrogenase family)
VSDHLTGKRYLVGGGTGDVGIAIVHALMGAGAEVVLPARSVAKAAAVRDTAPQTGRLIVIDDFPVDDTGVSQLQEELAGIGPLDGAVASLGPWFHGPALIDLPLAHWSEMVAAALTSHFLFAKAAVPVLARGGQYIMINGAGSETPVPHSGVVSIVARAQTMLGDVLRAENPHIRLHTLMLRSVIATRMRPNPEASWITDREVGEAVGWLFGPQGRLTAGSTVSLNVKMLT